MGNKEIKFRPKPGQVDYTNVRWTPVINCVVKYRDKILIVQRNANMRFYPEYWNGISGFLDDNRSIKEKAKDELKEELGIDGDNITSIRLGEIFHQKAPEYNKTWIVHPVLIEVGIDRVVLDWEAHDYKWIEIGEAKNFKLLPGFDKVLEKLSLWIG